MARIVAHAAAQRYTIRMNKLPLFAAFGAVLGLAFSLACFAQDRSETGDRIEFPEPGVPEAVPGDSAAPRPMLPRRGASMGEVQREFGPPGEKHPPAGGGSPKHPPITRWDYERFSVFFERDHVIHSVVRDAPAPIYHKEELEPVRIYEPGSSDPEPPSEQILPGE